MPVAIAAAAAGGLLLGLPTLRLRADYFAIADGRLHWASMGDSSIWATALIE